MRPSALVSQLVATPGAGRGIVVERGQALVEIAQHLVRLIAARLLRVEGIRPRSIADQQSAARFCGATAGVRPVR